MADTIFSVIVLLLAVGTVSGQNNCPDITAADLETLIARNIASGDNTQLPAVSVTRIRPVCRAQGEQRDGYRYVSLVVEYTCTGNAECPSSSAVEQFESGCGSGNAWTAVVGSTSLIRTTNPLANFTTTARDDCAFCFSDDVARTFPVVTDNVTHCVACDESCNEGLRKCTGRLDTDCCQYYDNSNVCVDACSSPYIPSNGGYCVCPLEFTGSNCTEMIDCGSLTHPANGDVLVLSTIFNSVAMYSCNAGYNLTGDTTRTCLGTGFWSGSEANCTDINECLETSSCLFGTCTNSDGSYSCECLEGYSGARCGENIDDCTAGSCLNGGVCVDRVASFSCNCPERLSGSRCETCDIDSCRTCDLSSNPARCAECSVGYTPSANGFCDRSGALGQNCNAITEGDIIRVLRNYLEEGSACPSASICQATLSVDEVFVNCLAPGRIRGTYSHVTLTVRYQRSDLSGIFLVQLDIGCSNATVQWETVVLRSQASSLNQVFAQGVGVPDNNTATSCAACLSPSLATELSLVSIDQVHHCVECDSTCFGVGLEWCYGHSSSECCSYYQMDECVSSCGERYEADNRFQCVCSGSWRGPSCSVCDLTCENGGTPDPAGCSQCACPPGYTDTRCQTDIDECLETSSCLFGTCTNLDGSYSCECLEGYSGARCGENIDDCTAGSCLNGGVCVDRVASFSCNCPDHLSGSRCETCDIDSCRTCDLSSNPARCTECSAGYTPSANGLCDCNLEYCLLCGGSPVHCLKCNEGYLMDNNNTCQCSISNCIQCDGSPLKCLQCNNPYTLINNECVLKCNVEFCDECMHLNDNICRVCSNGYALENGRCRENPVTMATTNEIPSVKTVGDEGNGLSSDEIAGIIAGAIILVILLSVVLLGVAIKLLKKWMKRSSNESNAKALKTEHLSRVRTNPTYVQSVYDKEEVTVLVESGTNEEPGEAEVTAIDEGEMEGEEDDSNGPEDEIEEAGIQDPETPDPLSYV